MLHRSSGRTLRLKHIQVELLQIKKDGQKCYRSACVCGRCWRRRRRKRHITQTVTTVSRSCRLEKWNDHTSPSKGEREENERSYYSQRWGGTVSRASRVVRWMFTFWREERFRVRWINTNIWFTIHKHRLYAVSLCLSLLFSHLLDILFVCRWQT